MSDLKIKLGKRIKYLRKSKNITQERLAEIINIDITSLSKIETGRNYPQPETIEKIADALNADIEQLFIFRNELSQSDYLDKIAKNLVFLKEDETKLKIIYNVLSALV